MNRFFVYVLVSAVFLLTATAVSADVQLRGTVGAITIDDNAVIPRDATATLNGTVIKGNLFVRGGARVITNGARIIGNVQAYGSLLVDLREDTYVGGDVQGKRTRSVRVRSGTFVGGSVQLIEASSPIDVDALLVSNAEVDGDVQAEKSAGRLRAIENQIGGSLQFVENYSGPYVITSNWIDSDLQFFKNRGKGTIIGNHVGGNLQSKENRPLPTISGNIVEGDTEIE